MRARMRAEYAEYTRDISDSVTRGGGGGGGNELNDSHVFHSYGRLAVACIYVRFSLFLAFTCTRVKPGGGRYLPFFLSTYHFDVSRFAIPAP